MIRDRRVRAALLIGMLLMAYGRPRASDFIYERHCSELEPWSWEWIYYGCYWAP